MSLSTSPQNLSTTSESPRANKGHEITFVIPRPESVWLAKQEPAHRVGHPRRCRPQAPTTGASHRLQPRHPPPCIGIPQMVSREDNFSCISSLSTRCSQSTLQHVAPGEPGGG